MTLCLAVGKHISQGSNETGRPMVYHGVGMLDPFESIQQTKKMCWVLGGKETAASMIPTQIRCIVTIAAVARGKAIR